MKPKRIGWMAVFVLSSIYYTHAALLSYEGFDYTAGSNIVGQNGGFGFSAAWAQNNSQGIMSNTATSLSYTDAFGNVLQTVGGALFIQGHTVSNLATQPNRLLSYSRGTNSGGTDGVTTWVSFLAVRRGPTTNSTTVPNNPYPRSANMSLYNFTTANTEKLAMGNSADTVSNNVAIIPTGNATNVKPSTVSYSRTNLIVVRIDHVVSGNDSAYLFMNPPLGSEPDISLADTNSIGAWDFSFNRIRPFAGGYNAAAQQPYAELILDEIRIGETFADVTPFIPSLHFARSGTDVVFTWSGTFNLQAADNVDGTYSTIASSSPQSVPISQSQRFFRLSQ